MKKYFRFNNKTKRILELSNFDNSSLEIGCNSLKIHLYFEGKIAEHLEYDNEETLNKDYDRLIRFLHKKEK